MNMTPRISDYVAQQVLGRSAGVVRGVFPHGMNVELLGGGLVFLGGFDRPLSCVGMQLPDSTLRLVLRQAQNEGEVGFRDAGFSLQKQGAPRVRVSLAAAQIVGLALEAPLVPRAQGYLLRGLQGLGLDSSIGLQRDKNLDWALRRLSATGPDQYHAVHWLYGRGPGLTPSGDDVLCGYGFGLLCCGLPAEHERLCKTIDLVASSRSTTSVSRAYLDAMAAGQVNETVLELVRAAREGRPLSGCLARARHYGHTSGNDVLFGLCAALSQNLGPSGSMAREPALLNMA